MNLSTSTHSQAVGIGVMVVALAAALTIGGPSPTATSTTTSLPATGPTWLQQIETGEDHISPPELARELLAAPKDLALVDLRPAEEFAVWHLPSAQNLTVPQVCGAEGAALFAQQPRLVVLYSNGPAHPGQAWVELQRQGHENVKVLAGGLDDFKAQVLTPPSLREGATEAASKAQLPAFALVKAFFLGDDKPNALATYATDPAQLQQPTMVSPKWLHEHLDQVAVLDVRKPDEFAALHVPGAQLLSLGDLRVTQGDRDLFFVPDADLAKHVGALGIAPTTPVVIYADTKFQDATLAAVALLRLGHQPLAILEGGILRWATEHRPLTSDVQRREPTSYEPKPGAAAFAIEIDELAATVKAHGTALLDVRPPEFFTGEKSTEARPGHIPGAKNRLFAKDLQRTEDGQWLRPRGELEREYGALGLAKDQPVVVSCRTGHTASEAWFVMRHLLGYQKARWYNGSWTEWSARTDLPAATGNE
jgi:3-mercaptopyruvate sulfurtransferase SseA